VALAYIGVMAPLADASADVTASLADATGDAPPSSACVPYAALLDGGPSCVRISYCAANPNMPGLTINVCCPAPIADGGVD